MDLYVSLKHSANCFVCLPPKLVHSLFMANQQRNVMSLSLEMKWTDKKSKQDNRVWVGWSGGATDPSLADSIEMDSKMAQCLGICEGQMVTIKAATVTPATTIQVEPVSSDDWEILEVHAEYLEQQILNQINVVFKNQTIPVWIHHKTVIHLKVIECSPNDVVKLSNDVEFIVSPKPRQQPNQQQGRSSNSLIPRYLFVGELNNNQNNQNNNRLPIGNASIYISKQAMKLFEWNQGDIIELTALKQSPSQSKLNNSFGSKIVNDDDKDDKEELHQQQIDMGHEQQNQLSRKHIYVRVYSMGNDSIKDDRVLINKNTRYLLNIFINTMVKVRLITSYSIPTCPIGTFSIHQTSWKNHTLEFAPKPIKVPILSSAILKDIIKEWAINQFNQNNNNNNNTQNNQNNYNGRIPLMNGSIITIPPSQKFKTPSIDICFKFNQQQQQMNQLNRTQQQQQQQKRQDLFSTLNNVLNYQVDGMIDQQQQQPHQQQQQSPIQQQSPMQQQQQQQNKNQFQMNHGVFMIGLDTFDIDFQVDKIEKLKQLEDFHDIGDLFYRIGGMEKKIKESKDYLDLLLKNDYHLIRNQLGTPGIGGIIITGSHGSGKTLLATALSSYFSSKNDTLAYVVKMNCLELSESKIEKIRKSIKNIFKKAMITKPSIILFEDLDKILTNPNEQDPGSKIKNQQLLSYFVKLSNQCRDQNRPLIMIATAQSTQTLNKELQSPELFGMNIEIPAPTREERIDILNRYFKSFNITLVDGQQQQQQQQQQQNKEINLLKISNSLEGYLGVDLEQLVERSIHLESISKKLPPNQVSLQTLELSRQGYTPISLKGIKLHESDAARWNDIGGLSKIKALMKETIGWPSRYPRLFQSSPIRMRSGILLYGPPGCGKTMLASSIAGECGLNFISVKGPELLNKYIGSSEQSVRDMFSRASAATPCVLFFDEFDSIAPRRGHDSTGVTDRVVNQFLTELDGVEGLKGVYVLAATSRPDLIDPALLRPGRLDKSVYCNIPENEERKEILEILASKMNIDRENVSIEELVEMTDGYTGADLRALMYNTQLKSIHQYMNEKEEAKRKQREEREQMEQMQQQNGQSGHNSMIIFQPTALQDKQLTNEEKQSILKRIEDLKNIQGGDGNQGDNNNNEKPQDAPPLISKSHFMDAFKQSTNSISQSEKKRYEQIYKNFLKERGSVTGNKKEGPKQTLA